jgi:hypothetical protein
MTLYEIFKEEKRETRNTSTKNIERVCFEFQKLCVKCAFSFILASSIILFYFSIFYEFSNVLLHIVLVTKHRCVVILYA